MKKGSKYEKNLAFVFTNSSPNTIKFILDYFREVWCINEGWKCDVTAWNYDSKENELRVLSSFFPEGKDITLKIIQERTKLSYEPVHRIIKQLVDKKLLIEKKFGIDFLLPRRDMIKKVPMVKDVK